MSPRTRRRFLRSSGLALGAFVTGCTSSPPVSTSPTSSPAETPTATATATDTTQFPPPEPTSAAPQDPTPMPTETDWPRFQFDGGNTGHRPGLTAVPDDPDTYWQFFVQSSPPVVADGSLYTAERDRNHRTLVARDAATGRVQWLRTADRGGAVTHPTVVGDTLLAQSYTILFAFDRTTGDQRWELDIGQGSPGSPVVVDGTAYLANGSYASGPSEAFAVDVTTGEEQWRVELGSGMPHLRGSVAVADGSVFVVDGDLVALDVTDGSERWRVTFDAPAETTPTTADGMVYVTDTTGTLHAVSAADGTEQWAADVGEPVRGTAAAVADDEVYVGTESGLVALTTGGSDRWQFSLSRATSPTVGTDAVYVGGQGFESPSAFALDRETGKRRWRYATAEKAISDYVQAGVRGPPTLVEGGVYVVAADGMHALGR